MGPGVVFIVVGGRGAVVVWLVVCEDVPLDDEWREDELCEDEPWLELLDLDFAPAGAAASAAAITAMEKDKASLVFRAVIPPRIRIA